jgi:uncharacterized protein (DUF58 family)
VRFGRRPGEAPPAASSSAATSPESRGGVPREVLRQVRLIELRTRGLVNSIFGGEYQSVFRGQGMEFSEVREYEAGDDVRNIDWNVTARTGRPHVKKHIEERELTLLLLVDVSGSEHFATRGRFKAELAAEIAAVLALSAVRNNDRVGLLIFTDVIEHVVPPKKGRRHMLRLIRDVLAFQPRGTGTDIGGALDYAARLMPHRGILFLLSDFVPGAHDGERTPDGAVVPWEKTLRLVSRRHDLVAVNLTDAAEEALPKAGLLVFIDPETGEEVAVDTGDPGVQAGFSARVGAEQQDLRRLFRRMGVDEIEVRTHESYVRPLLSFFRRRERKRAR